MASRKRLPLDPILAFIFAVQSVLWPVPLLNVRASSQTLFFLDAVV